MKTKIILFFIASISWMLISCQNDRLEENLLNTKNSIENLDGLKEKFSYALAKVFNESKGVRELIKKEALKQFDYDYDVLYMLIKDHEIGGEDNLEKQLLRYISKEDLRSLTQRIPTLTIFVPYLYGNIFSAEKWNIETEIPCVAYENAEKRIVYIDSYGTMKYIADNEMPAFPIVVVKPSERVVLQSTSTKSSNNSSVLQSSEGLVFVFEYTDYDNTTSAKTRAVYTKDIPADFKKIFEAKKFADQNNIWQRDYIYYGIQTKDGKGPFAKNISECIYSFELVGNTKNIFNIISDQEDDPHHKEGKVVIGGALTGAGDSNVVRRRNSSSRWSDNRNFWYNGNFEFLVKLYVSNSQLTSNEIIKALSIPPYELFDLDIAPLTKRQSTITILGVDNFKKYYLPHPLPLFDWNIENYSASIKISIEEKDAQITTQHVVETTTNFASNFNFDPTFKEIVKVGAKFGASSSVQHKISTTVTTYQNSDQLGDVIINFGDDVIVKDELVEVSSTSYSTYYEPALNPKYTSGYYKIEVAPLPQY